MHPADVAHFLSVARMPGKPVPFVPVIDADVRRWYQSDSLWQSHSDLYDADQVLIIPGPVAVSGITTADEPVADLLDRFEVAVAETLVGEAGRDPATPPSSEFRLAHAADLPRSGAEALLAAALRAPTWLWLDTHRPNPLHRIGDAEAWTIVGDTAIWSAQPGEDARLSVAADGSLVLTVHWPDLGLPGDGGLVLGVQVLRHAGVVTFAVTEQSLGTAGSGLLAMFTGGTAAPSAPSALAAAHAGTVGAATALPDRLMSTLWPSIFGALAQADLAPAIFDLVHLSHEIELAEAAEGRGLPPGSPQATAPEVARTDGGLVVTVRSGTPTAHVVDRFFVRRSAVDGGLPVAAARPDRPDVVPTPVRALGSLTVTAPLQLEAFATVSGDANPIHRSDVLARFVGLPGRIVHGMWTSAAATRAVLETVADGDGERLREWQIDFVAPVLPGQDVTFTVTRTGMRAGAHVVAVEAATSDGVVAMGSGVVAGPRTMYVFPGQGIQSQGMGMDGYARSTAARDTWDRADATTRERMGFSILEIVRDNPQSVDASGVTYRHPAGVLHLTQFTQVAMATLAMATVAEMRAAGVFDPTAAVAGHSVGEYNALGASNGVMSLESAIELVYARGWACTGLCRGTPTGAPTTAWRSSVRTWPG
jgi:fatty acid synthase